MGCLPNKEDGLEDSGFWIFDIFSIPFNRMNRFVWEFPDEIVVKSRVKQDKERLPFSDKVLSLSVHVGIIMYILFLGFYDNYSVGFVSPSDFGSMYTILPPSGEKPSALTASRISS